MTLSLYKQDSDNDSSHQMQSIVTNHGMGSITSNKGELQNITPPDNDSTDHDPGYYEQLIEKLQQEIQELLIQIKEAVAEGKDISYLVQNLIGDLSKVSELKMGENGADKNEVNQFNSGNVPKLPDVSDQEKQQLQQKYPKLPNETDDQYQARLKIIYHQWALKQLIDQYMNDVNSGKGSVAELLAFLHTLNDPDFITNTSTDPNNPHFSYLGPPNYLDVGNGESLGEYADDSFKKYLAQFKTTIENKKDDPTDPFFKNHQDTVNNIVDAISQSIDNVNSSNCIWEGNLNGSVFSLWINADPSKFGYDPKPYQDGDHTVTPQSPSSDDLNNFLSSTNQLQSALSGASKVLDTLTQQVSQVLQSEYATLKTQLQNLQQLYNSINQSSVQR